MCNTKTSKVISRTDPMISLRHVDADAYLPLHLEVLVVAPVVDVLLGELALGDLLL